MTAYEVWSVAIQVAVGTVGLATLYLLYRQMRLMADQLGAMQDATRAQSGLALVGFLQAADVRIARQHVREVLSTKPIENWSTEDRRLAAVVVSNYDVSAALIRSGMASIDLITANWGPSIAHCHQVLGPYIAEQRSRPGGSKRYWSNFEWLAAAARDP